MSYSSHKPIRKEKVSLVNWVGSNDKNVPVSPIIDTPYSLSSICVGFFPNLMKVCSDVFLDDSLRLSPLPTEENIIKEIITYIKRMAELFKRNKPELEECILRLKFVSSYPDINIDAIINKAVEAKIINRTMDSNNNWIVSVV